MSINKTTVARIAIAIPVFLKNEIITRMRTINAKAYDITITNKFITSNVINIVVNAPSIAPKKKYRTELISAITVP